MHHQETPQAVAEVGEEVGSMEVGVGKEDESAQLAMLSQLITRLFHSLRACAYLSGSRLRVTLDAFVD